MPSVMLGGFSQLNHAINFVIGKVPPEVKVQINRRNGTLAVRFRGMAFVLFRVSLPPNGNGMPSIIDGDRLPPTFLGLTQEDIGTAKRMAADYIATLRG